MVNVNKSKVALVTGASSGMRSLPTVIANLVAKALSARKPKTRYVAGQLAKPLIFIRKWFGDRMFDKAVLSQVK